MKDLTGMKFGKWTVLKFSHKNKYYSPHWLCRCECKIEKIVRGAELKNGSSTQCKGCACKNKFLKHGLREHPLYKVWAGMKTRCYNPNRIQYKNWGGRGIAVCDEWKDNPKAFYDWSIANGWKKGLEIDRINNEGNYEPNNCRFIPSQINNQNKSDTKLNSGKVYCIKGLLKSKKYKQKQIAEWMNITKYSISDISRNKSWRNV